MRLKILFTTMIAALAFAGCSSEEDDPINKGDENTDDGYGYVARKHRGTEIHWLTCQW